MAIGVLLAGAGVLVSLTAAPVDAATVGCNGSLVTTSLAPGDSGSCTFSYSETAAQLGNPFTVTVSVVTSSTSGKGAAGSGTATEALVDGTATGLHVTVTDSADNTFDLGTPTCSGASPDAGSCSSSALNQAVPGTLDTSSWSDTFTVSWSLPLAAGNPYQGGSATVTVTPYYNGIPAPTPVPPPTPAGRVLGVSFSPSPTSGVLGASTPSTGAGPTSTGSLVLIALGMVLLLIGASGVGWARRSRPPTP
jgi:hypothetical protein